MSAEEKAQAAKDDAILIRLWGILTADQYAELIDFMNADGVSYNYDIIATHGGDKQIEESEWFEYIYLDQKCGYSGDDYYGTVWVPLPEGKYFKFDFQC